MITKEEIARIASAKNLTSFQIEKDYVLGWILAGIAHDPVLSKSWVFKGGTCIHKCYFDNYRYSEDLDFTITDSVMVKRLMSKPLKSLYTLFVCGFLKQQELRLILTERCSKLLKMLLTNQ